MTNELNESKPHESEALPRKPDYIAKQFRQVRGPDGWVLRKEQIGAAWNGLDGAIRFRPSGVQVVSGDVFLYPILTPSE